LLFAANLTGLEWWFRIQSAFLNFQKKKKKKKKLGAAGKKNGPGGGVGGLFGNGVPVYGQPHMNLCS
jgi:hypothetical protein